MLDLDYDALAATMPTTPKRDFPSDAQLLDACLRLLAALAMRGDDNFRRVGEITDALYPSLNYIGTKRSLSSKMGKAFAGAIGRTVDIEDTRWQLQYAIQERLRVYRLVR